MAVLKKVEGSQIQESLAGLRRDIVTQNGNVVLIKDVLRNLEAPSYLNCIQGFGFDTNALNKLLNGTHTVWATKPIYEGYYPPDKPIEYIIVRNDTTTNGKTFEATVVTTSEASTMKIRLLRPPEEFIGFEAILLQEGSITYDVLNGFNQTAGVYTAIGKPTGITLEPGDLLLIPRSVARQISKVVPGSRYLYIGDPWTDKDLPAEITN